MVPDYLIYIGLAVLTAVISGHIKLSMKGSAIAIAGAILAVGLLTYGVYRFTQREAPCGGLETLEGATWEETACVIRALEKPVIPK
jgi:hypothetical protein